METAEIILVVGSQLLDAIVEFLVQRVCLLERCVSV